MDALAACLTNVKRSPQGNRALDIILDLRAMAVCELRSESVACQ